VRQRRGNEFFFGPQITQLFADQVFKTKLNSASKIARKSFEEAYRQLSR